MTTIQGCIYISTNLRCFRR